MQDNYKKYLEIVKKLRPIDDVLFHKLAEDKGFCQELLRVILQDEKLEVISNRVQVSLKNLRGRSVILDLECVLSDGLHYNIEVQKSDDENHIRRANYNASLMEMQYSEKNKPIGESPMVIVIFITQNDFLHGNKAIYHQDSYIDGKLIDDRDVGRKILYVNAQADDNTELSEYMKQFLEPDDEKIVSSNLKRVMTNYKKEEVKSYMCKELDELIKQERAEERTEAFRELDELIKQERAEVESEVRAKERAEAIKNMLLIGGSKEKIIELGYSEDEYEKAVSLLNEN